MTGEPTILHADVDSFFAAVEQRDRPHLRGRPVLVGGWVILAASYEAKAHGVHTPMSVGLARRLCPGAIVVEPRMAAYAEASRDVYRVFEDTTPLVEGLSIDEAFLDVRGLARSSGSPSEIAVRLRAERVEVGNCPTAEVEWNAHPGADDPVQILASFRAIFRAHGVVVRDDDLYRAMGWDPRDLDDARRRITQSG